MKQPYVFISYSTKDQKFADNLCKVLKENKINTWIASKDIHAGESFANEITHAVNNCKVFLFVMSKNSDDSPHCGNELSLAFSARKRIIPYRLHEFKLSEANTYFLQQAQWIDAYVDESSAISELITKISVAFEEKDEEVTVVNIKTSDEKKMENFIKRAYLSLEMDDFADADKYAEDVLDIDVEYSDAYLVKLLCALKLKSAEDLKNYEKVVATHHYFIYAKRFANDESLKKLTEIENENRYNYAQKNLESQHCDYEDVKKVLNEIKGYKDVDEILKSIPIRIQKEEEQRKEEERIRAEKRKQQALLREEKRKEEERRLEEQKQEEARKLEERRKKEEQLKIEKKKQAEKYRKKLIFRAWLKNSWFWLLVVLGCIGYIIFA